MAAVKSKAFQFSLLIPAIVLAAMTALLTPGSANAEDPSWDVDVYDTCIESSWDAADSDPDADSIDWNTVIDLCCTRSGGLTVGPANDTSCVAPPAGRSPGAPGGPGAPPKPGGTPPQVSDPGLAPPPPAPTTTPLIAPAPAPGLAPR
jgi:hypothetical protein